MSLDLIDLRTDTARGPSGPALRAMTAGGNTATGDLEEYCAALFGKESALFMPSGTVSNQVALKVLAGRGRPVLCDAGNHLDAFDASPAADLGGVTINAVATPDGFLRPPVAGSDGFPSTLSATSDGFPSSPAASAGLFRSSPATTDRFSWPPAATPGGFHRSSAGAPVGLIWTENTVSARGGRIYPLELLADLHRWGTRHGGAVYLDGARIMHAVAATGIAPAAWGATSDAMALSVTEGLGAPMGSVLLGTAEFITAARRHRRWYGGSLRQRGPFAAAALWALLNNSARLADDHASARLFAAVLAESPLFTVTPPDTNIVLLDVAGVGCPPAEFVARAADAGVRVLARRGSAVRAVFDHRTSARQARRAAERLITVARQLKPVRPTTPARLRWWYRIDPPHPVTVTSQMHSRTWA
ncbi:threonine aldolase family protein [Actinoplanes subglobosus]|uniref:Threonine aldolase family protein n=1 Tax=Actinoplanes subglobosus TaxID=1547892 RepID=A0ABV8J2R5_9ACTN